MRKILKFISILLFLAVALFLVLFVTLIYPDDRRIGVPDLTKLKRSNSQKMRLQSLFDNLSNFRLDISLEAYKEKLASVAKTHTNVLLQKSARFYSPYQTYLSVGSYPYHLEGRDAIYIPSQSTLKVFPKIHGLVSLDLAAVSLFSDGQLSIALNGRPIDNILLPGTTTPEKSDNFIFKNFTRYAYPDRPIKGGEWSKHNIDIELTTNDVLEFRCTSKGNACFLDNFTIWGETTNASKPNVIYILVDTLRYDALKSTHAKHLQKMNEQALSFENAMGAGNMTAISANALLTCQKPSKLGHVAFSYGLSTKEQDAFYSKKKPSFPFFLQQAGIKTAMIGNISIISEILGIGINHGFDEQIAIEMDGYDAPHITRKAIDWLQKNADKPFFLYLHYNTTHAPYRAPLHDILATFDWSSLSSQRNFLLSLYQAEIRYIDRNLEILNQAIDKLGLDKNTTIILNSDHGDTHELRTYTENEAGPDYTGSLFDHVGTILYNDVLHVPLFILEPNKNTHQKSLEIVSGLDIGPTVLKIFGLKTPRWCDGLSLFSPNSLQDREAVGAEGYDQRAIFYKNRYKYIKSYASSEKRMAFVNGYFTKNTSVFIPEQLFDLQIDPNELQNLISSNKQLANEVRAAFQQYFAIKNEILLVVDAPNEGDIHIHTTKSLMPIGTTPDAKHVSTVRSNSFEFTKTKRVVLRFDKTPSEVPRIYVSGQEIKPKFSSYRLALQSGLKELPIENVDLDHIPLASNASAFFVKIRSDQTLQQKFSMGNKDFEKIFKDWGYVSDTN